MLCVSVDFDIKPDAFGACVPRVRQQAWDSLHDGTDCQVFEVWTSGVRPDKLHLHEVCDDAGAFDLHLKSAHYRSFDADI